jgi:hypothetical protein
LAPTIKILLLLKGPVVYVPRQIVPLQESGVSGVLEFSGKVVRKNELPLFGPVKLSSTL